MYVHRVSLERSNRPFRGRWLWQLLLQLFTWPCLWGPGYIERANLDRFENDVPVLPAPSGLFSLCFFAFLFFSLAACLFRFSTFLFVCCLWLWLLLINGYSHFMNIVRGSFSSSFLHHFSPFLFFFLLPASSICYRVTNSRKSSILLVLYFPVSVRAYYYYLPRVGTY